MGVAKEWGYGPVDAVPSSPSEQRPRIRKLPKEFTYIPPGQTRRERHKLIEVLLEAIEYGSPFPSFMLLCSRKRCWNMTLSWRANIGSG